jgi:hypothetical protein
VAWLVLGATPASLAGTHGTTPPHRPAETAATTTGCEEAYSNLWSPPTYFYPAGAGVEVVDDLHLGPSPVGSICSFDVGYHHAGIGAATATVHFYANDPLDAPPGTPLASFTVPGLAPGSQVFHVEVPATALGQDVWLGVSFDQADAGLLLAQPPWPGQGDDLFYELPAGVYRTFGGNPPANFMLGVTASAGVGSVEDGAPTTAGILRGPTPNPSGDGVDVRFGMPVAGLVRAEILDAQGRIVITLARRTFLAGEHSLSWDGTTERGVRAAPGIYWLRVTLPGYAGSRKLALVH